MLNKKPIIPEKITKNIARNETFFSRWAGKRGWFGYDRFLVQFWMKRFHRPLFAELVIKKEVRFLDVSCGTGELLKKLCEKSSKNVNLEASQKAAAKWYGVDISPGMLEKARAKLPKEVVLQEADVHQLPFHDNLFDYVVSTEAFHHYHSQEKALQELIRITKPSGKVIIIDINFFFTVIHRLFAWLEPGCVKVNSRKEIRRLFENNGLTVVKQKRSFLFAVMTVGEKMETSSR